MTSLTYCIMNTEQTSKNVFRYFILCDVIIDITFPIVPLETQVALKLILVRNFVIIMSRMSFRVILHSIVCLNVKELLARSSRRIWSLTDSNGIRTHNRLVRKRTLNHLAQLASLAKWVSVSLQIKWLWVQIPVLFMANNF